MLYWREGGTKQKVIWVAGDAIWFDKCSEFFQREMDRLLVEYRKDGIFIYIHDILGASRSWVEHMRYLRTVLEEIREGDLVLYFLNEREQKALELKRKGQSWLRGVRCIG